MKLTLLAAGFAGGVLVLAGATAAAADPPGPGGPGDPGAHHPVTVSASWSRKLAHQGDSVVLTAVAVQPSVPTPSITITATVPADMLRPADGAGCRTDPAANTITCSSTSYRKAPFRFVVKAAESRTVVASVTAKAGTGDAGRTQAELAVDATTSPSPSASSSPSASPSDSPSESPSAQPSDSTAPSDSASASPIESAPPSASPSSDGGGLPVTGTSLTIFGVLAAVLLAAGGVLLVLARRRRTGR
ncbi:LPXTG cell wall anchor domain-containing protein [Actinocatenispora sera]|uniref:LPXTG cell wall anchor domain-containing protein n=1 Tax=Actinocatenispora sera TaxID=390989 RepID=UPI0033C3B38D